MKIKYNPTYVSYDGREFENENECKKYEKRQAKDFLGTLKKLKQFCYNMEQCENCHFFGEDGGCIIMENVMVAGELVPPGDWNF